MLLMRFNWNAIKLRMLSLPIMADIFIDGEWYFNQSEAPVYSVERKS